MTFMCKDGVATATCWYTSHGACVLWAQTHPPYNRIRAHAMRHHCLIVGRLPGFNKHLRVTIPIGHTHAHCLIPTRGAAVLQVPAFGTA